MAVDLCSESSSATMSPRLSFSYDLSQSDVIPIEQRIFRSNSSSSNNNNIDFDFCVLESFEVESSSADELFFDGKILPIQIKRKMLPPKPPQAPSVPAPAPPVESLKETKLTRSDSDDKQSSNSKSFWRFKCSSSSLNLNLNCERTLCSLPILSRSNSAGSAPKVKKSSFTNNKNNQNLEQSFSRNSEQSQSSSSFSYLKPPLKKSYGAYYGNDVRINKVLNVPSTNVFCFCFSFSSGQEKNTRGLINHF